MSLQRGLWCPKQPACIGVDVDDVARPDPEGLGHGDLPIVQVGHDRQVVFAVGKAFAGLAVVSKD